jgi:Mrp family chromosome partitioning ATPase
MRGFRVSNPDAKLVLLDDLEVQHLLYAERHVGKVHAFPDEIVKKLEALELFTEKYGFQYMRRPMSVIRQNSGLVARQLLAQGVRHLGTKDRRVIVSGKGGTGKSFILLQIAAMALMQDYVVIAVPRGLDLVDNRTAYQLDESTMRYRQTDYMEAMLGRTRVACADALAGVYSGQIQLITATNKRTTSHRKGRLRGGNAIS